MHLTQMAVQDGKPIAGLESVTEQIEMISGMGMESQVELLMYTLRESGDIEKAANAMVDAWQSGDTAFLVEEVVGPMSEAPEIAEAMLTRRNRNWIDDIEAALSGDDDVMVVVGAAHLVGPDNVVALMKARGHRVRRVRD